MKKQILTLLLIGYSIIVNAQVENLDKLPLAKRDSVLLEVAKQTILKYGPEFYEINQPPVIERKVTPVGDKNAGRVRFIIKYGYKKEFYDKFPDFKYLSYLAEVRIWEDTGLAYSVGFGNRGIADLDKYPKTRNANRKRPLFKRNPWQMVYVDDTTKND